MAFNKIEFRKLVTTAVPANSQPENTLIVRKKTATFSEHFEMDFMSDPTASGFPVQVAAKLAAGSPVYFSRQSSNVPADPATDILTATAAMTRDDINTGTAAINLTIAAANVIPGTYKLTYGYMFASNIQSADFVANLFNVPNGAALTLGHQQEVKDSAGTLGPMLANNLHGFTGPMMRVELTPGTVDYQIRFGSSDGVTQMGIAQSWIMLERIVETLIL